MEYFLFILFFSIIALVFIPKKNDQTNLYFFLVLTVALIIGLRGNQDEYSQFYYIIPSLDSAIFSDFYSEKEPFFSFVVSLFQYWSLPSQFIFIFFSSVAVMLNGIFFKKMTPFYFLAFLIYLSHAITIKEFSGLRLGYASALVLPMIYFIQRKEYTKFTLTYALSSMVQYVGLLSIVLIFFNRAVSYKILLFGILSAILFNYLHFTETLINSFVSFNFAPQIIADYVNSSYHSYQSSIVFHLKTLQQIITILIMIFCIKKYKILVSPRVKYFNLLFNAYYFGTILLILFSSVAIFAYRFSAHFMSVEPIILTYFIWLFRDKKLPYIVLIIISLVIAYINYVVFQRIESYKFLIQ
jgi:hypothetical protein